MKDVVEAAFAAADDAIERTLQQGGPWGEREISAVLTLLLTRYGLGVARETTLEGGIGVVDMAASAAVQKIQKLAREEGLNDA